ncbi:hypothetical protein ACLOJK_033378 [Asimina triloba]
MIISRVRPLAVVQDGSDGNISSKMENVEDIGFDGKAQARSSLKIHQAADKGATWVWRVPHHDVYSRQVRTYIQTQSIDRAFCLGIGKCENDQVEAEKKGS